MRTNGLRRFALAPCSICSLKTRNEIEVQKYLFGINGLAAHVQLCVCVCYLCYIAVAYSSKLAVMALGKGIGRLTFDYRLNCKKVSTQSFYIRLSVAIFVLVTQ